MVGMQWLTIRKNEHTLQAQLDTEESDMLKLLIGAFAVVLAVGYGFITADDIHTAGDKARSGVNYLLERGAEATRGSETVGQKVDRVLGAGQ
jgi:hypothetical protein